MRGPPWPRGFQHGHLITRTRSLRKLQHHLTPPAFILRCRRSSVNCWGVVTLRGELDVVEGAKAVMGVVDDEVESDVECEDCDDDEPAGEEVDQEARSVACEPAP